MEVCHDVEIRTSVSKRKSLALPFDMRCTFKRDMISEAAAEPESIPSSQTGVRELSPQLHQRGQNLELPANLHEIVFGRGDFFQ